jgi:hypothetical protein
MVDFNESLNMTEFNEKNVEERLAIELEERQELGWVCACDSVCGVIN